MSPTQYNVMQYVAFLNGELKSPGAVMNYVSAARTWVRLMGGGTTPFDTYPVALVKRGVGRGSLHVPRPAPPLTVSHIKSVIRYFRSAGPNARVLIVAIILAFQSLLRQGNLLTSISNYDPRHTLMAGDVEARADGLRILVRSHKASRGRRDIFTVALPRIPGSNCCPVKAWRRYRQHTRLQRDRPALLMPCGSPLTAPTLTAAMRLALSASGHPAPHSITLHSLRRGGAQACARAGATIQQVQELGAWRSSAVHSYVPKRDFGAASLALSSLFG